ncbi:MAG: SRPBCC family protein [Halioglobus sp.]|nr:SRPBCC family protein [Halioglobus sp.]
MRVLRYALAALLVLLVLYVGACTATSGDNDPPLEHRWSIDFPHSPQRLWALMQDYGNWTQYAPMVIEVQVLHPGDAQGNGLLRRVIYQMPLGRRGSALELVTDVTPARGYTYTMISATPGNDQTGKLRLERLGRNETRLHFEERYNLTAFPWRLFEKQIYGFINKKNEESMRSMSAWLTEHPEYRPDLVET